MSNPHFQCKHFTVHQDRCAMKVCTDACLFGAWTANVVCSRKMETGNAEMKPVRFSPGAASPDGAGINQILDIGSGTGLLALMLAQKTEALIDTIEIDPDAYRQAAENCAASDWSSRIRVIHADVKTFPFTVTYDLIVANPPFFEQQLRSPVAVTNAARHDVALKWDELIAIVDKTLKVSGLFAVLLPCQRSDHFITLAGSAGLYLRSCLYVRQSAQHAFFRALLLFGREPCSSVEREDLIIKEDGRYSQRFVDLLKDYYLYL